MKTKLLVILSLLSIDVYSQHVPVYVNTNGLVAWYSFTGNANDSSGKGNHGATNNVMLTNDRLGKVNSAYNFIGGDTSYIQTPISNFNTGNDFTITVWAKIKQNVNNAAIIASRSSSTRITGLGIDTSRSYFYLSDFSTSYDASYRDGIKDTNWHFIAGVFNADTMFLYVDNLLRKTHIRSITASIGATFKIGVDDYDNKRGFIGSIDDIGIWSRALKMEELTALYKGGDTATNDIAGIIGDNKVEIYPNPVNDILHVKSYKVINRVEIFNVIGQPVFAKTYHSYTVDLDLSELVTGQYILRVNNYTVRRLSMK